MRLDLNDNGDFIQDLLGQTALSDLSMFNILHINPVIFVNLVILLSTLLDHLIDHITQFHICHTFQFCKKNIEGKSYGG